MLPLSHDEVVHGKGSLLGKMPGDDWQRFANLRALFAWMWAMPGAPLLFMGAEIAPFTEWSESSGLPWHLLDFAPHRGVRDLLTDLNRRAEEWPCVHERDHEPTGFQWLEADSADESIYAFLRWGHGGGSSVACVANFTPVPRQGHRIGLPWSGEWQVLVDTDSPAWGGSGYAGYDVGGTWFWNRYPGCRCDVESLEYSYSFDPKLEQEWSWEERYGTQAQILEYAKHVADRFDLRKDFEFNTRVTDARWDDETQRWTIATSQGGEASARFLICATGALFDR